MTTNKLPACPECKGAGMVIYVHPRLDIYQLQRCDICKKYESDNIAVEAALSLAHKAAGESDD